MNCRTNDQPSQLMVAKEPQVLVGFGKHDLADLLEWRGTDREEELIQMPLNQPARWRRQSICTPEEISNFVGFTNWMKHKLDDRGVPEE